MTYEEEKFRERLVEEKKTSLRTQSGQLDFAAKITNDLSFHASIFLGEQQKLSLVKEESSATLLKRLSELAETAAKLSADFNELSISKLRQADSIIIANFSKL